MKNELPVLLLTGYLGSGKTTLLNRILSNERGIKFAVIVNDIGEVNIDADLIQKGGVVDQKDDSLVALQNGCICCTLKMDLVEQIAEITAMQKFDYLVIEASGICEPQPIAQTICSIPQMEEKYSENGVARLDCIVSVVDALRMRDEFGSGLDLLNKNLDEDDIENLVIQQIEFCNIVLLNKASEVSAEELGRVREIIRALNSKAEIIECDYGNVELTKLLNTNLFDFNATVTSATWVKEVEKHLDEIEDDDEEHEHHHHHDDDDHDHDHNPAHGEEGHHCDEHCHHHHHHEHKHEGESEDEYGIGTFIYYRRKPFNRQKLDEFANKWPRNIIRCKGLMWFGDEPEMAWVFETSGRQIQAGYSGQWIAACDPKEQKKILDANPKIKDEWDEKVGDRMIKLCVIGQNLDKEAISAELDKCLED